MLKEQRLSLFNGGGVFSETTSLIVSNDSNIENLYLECRICFENIDIYIESAGEVISNGITKLKAFIQSIIDKVKDFFNKFKNDEEAKVDPTVEVDEKEVSKVKKFFAAVKKVIAIPYNKLKDFLESTRKLLL